MQPPRKCGSAWRFRTKRCAWLSQMTARALNVPRRTPGRMACAICGSAWRKSAANAPSKAMPGRAQRLRLTFLGEIKELRRSGGKIRVLVAKTADIESPGNRGGYYVCSIDRKRF